MTRKWILLGFFVGSTIGGFVPALWGDDSISISGFVFSIAGGIVGIWAGYRMDQSL